MHTAFLSWNTSLTPVRNQACPLDSLENTLETPRRWGTSKEASDFKIDTKLSSDIHTAFLSWNTSLTTVRNQASPLKTPWRTLWRHLGDGVLLRKLETSKLIQSFQVTCILRSLRKIYHWLQSVTRHVLLGGHSGFWRYIGVLLRRLKTSKLKQSFLVTFFHFILYLDNI